LHGVIQHVERNQPGQEEGMRHTRISISKTKYEISA
jgi:hypothetical protein